MAAAAAADRTDGVVVTARVVAAWLAGADASSNGSIAAASIVITDVRVRRIPTAVAADGRTACSASDRPGSLPAPRAG